MADVFKNGHALLIGVGADLPETVVDATAINNILVNPNRAAYPGEQVTLLREQTATRQNILDEFEKFTTSVNNDPAATAMVYYSGHGGEFERHNQPTEYFLCPYGYDPNNLAATALTGLEFTQHIQALNPKKLIVLLDCCHAGGIPSLKDATERFKKGAAPPSLLQAMESGSGRVVVASSRSDESSLGGTPNSVFTSVLLEALSGKAARKKDGYAKVLDVLGYLLDEVPQRALPFPQHPFVNKIEDLSDNFALCYYAGGAKDAPGVIIETPPSPSYSSWTRFKLQAELDTLMPRYEALKKKIAYLQEVGGSKAEGAARYEIDQEILRERTRMNELAEEIDKIQQALDKLH